MARTRSEAAKSSSDETSSVSKLASKTSKKSASKITRFNVLLDSGITTVVLTGIAFLIAYDYVKVSDYFNGGSLSGLGSRLEFTFRSLPIGLSWIIFCVVRVSIKRLNSKAIDPVAGHEDIIDVDSRILQNSLEQYIISVVAQLSISSQKLNGPDFVKIICFLNATFIIGRIVFFIGYPNRRSCGFITTALPSYLATAYSLAKLIQTLYVP